MKKQKIKPAEKILSILRFLGQEHSEMSLAFHITLATEDTKLENLSDKEFLEYLETYQDDLNLEDSIATTRNGEEDPFYSMELPEYEDEED